MTKTTVPTPLILDAAQRYTVEEAIALLRTSRQSIYKMIGTGRLPIIKQGRRTFIAGAAICALSTSAESRDFSLDESEALYNAARDLLTAETTAAKLRARLQLIGLVRKFDRKADAPEVKS